MNLGKILWLSGAPGMGKSTSAQILARENGYVYYEADCFAQMKNPYIPLDKENPSLGSLAQKALKGIQCKVVFHLFHRMYVNFTLQVLVQRKDNHS